MLSQATARDRTTSSSKGLALSLAMGRRGRHLGTLSLHRVPRPLTTRPALLAKGNEGWDVTD